MHFLRIRHGLIQPEPGDIAVNDHRQARTQIPTLAQSLAQAGMARIEIGDEVGEGIPRSDDSILSRSQ